MKVVDKYELAKEPWGTPFYCLTKDGFINKREGTLLILDSHTFYRCIDNKPMFNGVCYLTPDFEENNDVFSEDLLPDKFELFSVDTDSNDFDDDDKFLVLNKEELKYIIDYLTFCYDSITKC